MRKQVFTTLALCTALICTACVRSTVPEKAEAQLINVPSHMAELAVTSVPIVSPLPAENNWKLSESDIQLIALVTMAEAEGECEEGKRLVIDTILNRVDSRYFPNTVQDVIYQPYHFSSIWNGRVERCEVREEICRLVREELESRTNYDVMLFTAGDYNVYGEPMFQLGNHYFSSYK